MQLLFITELDHDWRSLVYGVGLNGLLPTDRGAQSYSDNSTQRAKTAAAALKNQTIIMSNGRLMPTAVS